MFRFLLFLFILVPIIEIGVFIQVGEHLGLGITLTIVIVTAILGVNLLKQQGFAVMRDIQMSLNQGKVPALEIASGAQLLFTGGLLLTPGFVTDVIGFLLMIPSIRKLLAKFLISRIALSASRTSSAKFESSAFYHSASNSTNSSNSANPTNSPNQGRVIEGELVDDEEPIESKISSEQEKQTKDIDQ